MVQQQQQAKNLSFINNKETPKKNVLKSNFKKIKKSFVSNYITDVVKDIIKNELVNVINKRN